MNADETAHKLASRPKELASVCEGQRVIEAAQLMRQHRVGCLIVVDDVGGIVGIVSERDILDWIGNASPQTFSARVGDIMSGDVITCDSHTPIDEIRRLMVTHKIRHLPVVENGKAVGMISSRDLMSHQLDPSAGR